jgi:hypothetical protein
LANGSRCGTADAGADASTGFAAIVRGHAEASTVTNMAIVTAVGAVAQQQSMQSQSPADGTAVWSPDGSATSPSTASVPECPACAPWPL